MFEPLFGDKIEIEPLETVPSGGEKCTFAIKLHKIKKLKMPQAAKVYAPMAREAEDNNLSYEDYLLGILEQELNHREQNRIQRGIRQASLTFDDAIISELVLFYNM